MTRTVTVVCDAAGLHEGFIEQPLRDGCHDCKRWKRGCARCGNLHFVGSLMSFRNMRCHCRGLLASAYFTPFQWLVRSIFAWPEVVGRSMMLALSLKCMVKVKWFWISDEQDFGFYDNSCSFAVNWPSWKRFMITLALNKQGHRRKCRDEHIRLCASSCVPFVQRKCNHGSSLLVSEIVYRLHNNRWSRCERVWKLQIFVPK